MNMKKYALLLCTLLAFVVSGCGAKTVNEKQITLNLAYGDRSGTYTGEVNDKDIPNGKGKFTTKNSSGNVWYYEGQFKDGHFVGKGKVTWATGQIEEGTFDKDRLNGKGIKTYKENGKETKYEGNFIAGYPMKEKIAKINEEVSFAEWKYKVTKVDTKNTIGNKSTSGKFVLVTMTMNNAGGFARQPIDGHAKYYLIDKETSKSYPINTDACLALRLANESWETPWIFSKINPGMTAEGVVLIFEMPTDVKVENLLLIPSGDLVDNIGGANSIQLTQ